MSKVTKLAHMHHHIDNGGVTLTVNESTDGMIYQRMDNSGKK